MAHARAAGFERWVVYLEPLIDPLRDGDIASLRPAARRVRAAYGPKDPVRDDLPPSVTDPCRDEIDGLSAS